MALRRMVLSWFFRVFLRIKVQGVEHLSNQPMGSNKKTGFLLLVNRSGFAGHLLLAASLPDPVLFAVHPHATPSFWVRFWLPWVRFVVVDPMEPKSGKPVLDHLVAGGVAVVFPSALPKESGPSPKYYGWSLLIAQESNVDVVAVHMDRFPGFCRLWPIWLAGSIFAPVVLTIIAPKSVTIDPSLDSRKRRQLAGQLAQDRLGEVFLKHRLGRFTLWQALCRAAREHGCSHLVITDSMGKSATYGQLLNRALILGELMTKQTRVGENVGVLLPTSTTTLTTFFALQAIGRVPAMLNFSVGNGPVLQACSTACIQTIYTSRQFVQKAKLESMVELLSSNVNVLFLEDLRSTLTPWLVLKGLFKTLFPERAAHIYDPKACSSQPAVILFTSGSEGNAKGVVLSHDNLLANGVQVSARIDIDSNDLMLNVLPVFHAFGLTIGSLVPLFAGVRSHCFPSPLEYHRIPELSYTLGATLLAGTDTFLSGYGRAADACDFFKMRYVFAGAEPLRESTQKLWMERFGVRILEGYGTTETGPVLSVNTPMACQQGSVGRPLPGVECRITEVPGISEGGLLSVSGPNIMLGYLKSGTKGQWQFPHSEQGEGWYDTGDIVHQETQGFLRIIGRAKRFAKIGGEMVSLALVERLVAQVWPEYRHAVVGVSDLKKGERLVLVTECVQVDRGVLLAQARELGLSGLYVPGKILQVKTLPLLASGKVDFTSVSDLIKQ